MPNKARAPSSALRPSQATAAELVAGGVQIAIPAKQPLGKTAQAQRSDSNEPHETMNPEELPSLAFPGSGDYTATRQNQPDQGTMDNLCAQIHAFETSSTKPSTDESLTIVRARAI